MTRNGTATAMLAVLLASALCAGGSSAQDTNGAARLRVAVSADSALLAGIAQQVESDLARGAVRRRLDSLQAAHAAAAPAPGRSRVPQMTAAREGERTTLRITGLPAGVETALSEPFLLEDRARVYLTLGTLEQPRTLPVATLERAGLLDVRTEAAANMVRVIVDAPRVDAYGIEEAAGVVELWIQAAPERAATPAAVALQQAHDDALPQPVPAATVHPAATAATPAQPRSDVHDERTDARQGARAVVTRMQDAGQQAIGALRDVTVQQRQLIGLVVSLVLLPFAAWSIVRLRAPHRARAAAGVNRAHARPSVLHLRGREEEPGSARLWAARTLAGQGLEAAEISERTGLCRDAATLLLATRVPVKAAVSGRNFRPPAPAAERAAAR